MNSARNFHQQSITKILR